MPRHKLTPGTWGKITRTKHTTGKWRARCRYRDFTGKTLQVEAWGPSAEAAERNLKTSLTDKTAPTGDDITADLTLNRLGQLWLQERETDDITAQTIDQYRATLHKIIDPGIGERTIREATVSALDRFLKTIAKTTPAQAKQAKVVLSGMLSMAARHDAIRTNPMRDVSVPRGKRQPVRALTIDDVTVLRRGVAQWQADPTQRGPKRAPDLLDVVDLLLATGARIGEVCAIRWDDIDMTADRPTVTISGTVIRIKGQGLSRQPHAKTTAGHRTITLPRFAVDTLLRRKVTGEPNPHNVVFPSSSGTLRDPHNLRRQWRDARVAAGFDWVVPHSFRKSVATLIDREASTKDAAAQLGHSGVDVTTTHYVQRAALAPDNSGLLEGFGSHETRIVLDG